jgi:hypothetical protein
MYHNRQPHTRNVRLGWHAGSLLLSKRRAQGRRRMRAFITAGTGVIMGLAALGTFLAAQPGRPQQAQSPWQPLHAVSLSPIIPVPQPATEMVAPTTPAQAPPTTPRPQTPKPAPPAARAFTTSISIKGNEACQNDTLAALRLLAEQAPNHYATVTTYVGVIECVAQGSGMAAYENPPRYLAGDATRTAGTLWYAGTIAHDAGHSKLYHDYLAAHSGQGVPGDIWTGQSAEAACLAAQHDALQKMDASQSTLDYVQSIVNSQYWQVPYSDRWW